MDDRHSLPGDVEVAESVGLAVSQPVALWNRPLRVNFKDLFQTLGKSVVDGACGQWSSYLNNGGEKGVARNN